MTRRLADVRNEEREALARDLHDTVAHHVTAIVVQARAAQAQIYVNPELSATALGAIVDSATQTLGEMRQVVRALREDEATTEVSPTAGVEAIDDLAEPSGTPRITVALRGELDGLAPHLAASLFRVAQEGVTNTRRHARNATQVWVTVEATENEVRLQVIDDGERRDRIGVAGFGVAGMRERVQLLDGEIRVGPSAERGWEINVVIPRFSADCGVGARR